MKTEFEIPQFTVDGLLSATKGGADYLELVIISNFPSKKEKAKKFAPIHHPVVKLIIDRQSAKKMIKWLNEWLKTKK